MILFDHKTGSTVSLFIIWYNIKKLRKDYINKHAINANTLFNNITLELNRGT